MEAVISTLPFLFVILAAGIGIAVGTSHRGRGATKKAAVKAKAAIRRQRTVDAVVAKFARRPAAPKTIAGPQAGDRVSFVSGTGRRLRGVVVGRGRRGRVLLHQAGHPAVVVAVRPALVRAAA